MRKIFFICFFLAYGFSFSQTITGTVVEKGSGLPLPFANVFVNNTTIGSATDAEGRQQEIHGIGGSWFRLDGEGLIEWQRDFFDFGHVQKLYLQLMQEGTLSTGMQERIQRSLAGEKLPGYYPLGQSPVPIW